jgi:IQ calmodulin-binding motif
MECEEQIYSAVVIQSFCRGATVRDDLLYFHTAATEIQRHVRSWFVCRGDNFDSFGEFYKMMFEASMYPENTFRERSLRPVSNDEAAKYRNWFFDQVESSYATGRYMDDGFAPYEDIVRSQHKRAPAGPPPQSKLQQQPSKPQPFKKQPSKSQSSKKQPSIPNPSMPQATATMKVALSLLSPSSPTLPWSLLPLSPLPTSLVLVPPAMQPLQLQVLTYCDDFVEYTLYHDENGMTRLFERMGKNAIDRRIGGNCKIEVTQDDTNQGSIDSDKTSTDNIETKESRNGKPRRKKQEFKEYTKVYIYQHDHYKKSRKRASRQANKCKTKDGKFLEGPAKDDDTYMSSNSSASEWGRMGQPPAPQRIRRKVSRKISRKVPRKTQAVMRRKKTHSEYRKASKQKNKKRVLAIQVIWSGQTKQRYLDCRALVQDTIPNGSRVWDAGRTNREGGGGPARVAKFRDRSTQQLGSAADSTPVVL